MSFTRSHNSRARTRWAEADSIQHAFNMLMGTLMMATNWCSLGKQVGCSPLLAAHQTLYCCILLTMLEYLTSSTSPTLQRTTGPGTVPSKVHQVYLWLGLTLEVCVVVLMSRIMCTG